MASEKNFENRVKDFLISEGCWFIKYWGGGEFTKAGIPDILCCCNGRFVAIEVKAPNGRPTELQIRSLMNIDRQKGYAFLLYPRDFGDFKKVIQEIQDISDGEFYASLGNYLPMRERWKQWAVKFGLL